ILPTLLFCLTVKFMQSLWMLLASDMFAAMGACVKVASDYGASMPWIVLCRGLPSVLLIYGWARSTGRSVRPARWRWQLLRNVPGVSAMWLRFYASSNLPLATPLSLDYSAPLLIAGWMPGCGGSQRDPVRILLLVAGFFVGLASLRPSIGGDQLFAA